MESEGRRIRNSKPSLGVPGHSGLYKMLSQKKKGKTTEADMTLTINTCGILSTPQEINLA